MSTIITDKQLHEIKEILRDGSYLRQGTIRFRVEHIGLAFSKYVLYAHIKNWRQNATKPFDDCLLSKGQRTKAMSFLIKRGILVYDDNRRARGKNFVKKIERLENEIKKKKELKNHE
jgi:hypothetical protein